MRANTAAALLDGDNLTRGGKLTRFEVEGVFHRISWLTRGLPVTMAAQQPIIASYMTAFVGTGWRTSFAGLEADAADRFLIEAGHEFTRRGCKNLIVASGDHAFATLATEARLHVLAYRGSLSRRLELTAHTVIYLDPFLSRAA